jgi:hypothetical protein
MRPPEWTLLPQRTDGAGVPVRRATLERPRREPEPDGDESRERLPSRTRLSDSPATCGSNRYRWPRRSTRRSRASPVHRPLGSRSSSLPGPLVPRQLQSLLPRRRCRSRGTPPARETRNWTLPRSLCRECERPDARRRFGPSSRRMGMVLPRTTEGLGTSSPCSGSSSPYGSGREECVSSIGVSGPMVQAWGSPRDGKVVIRELWVVVQFAGAAAVRRTGCHPKCPWPRDRDSDD